ncbi:zinc-binding dehydrogenase [Nocardia sp. CA-120079]|uniref:zinc-binding dehydrogenase n=1 Tax=Nocardia sp. CA-120079 TaxID=3239974 RepID=UPI003D96974C
MAERGEFVVDADRHLALVDHGHLTLRVAETYPLDAVAAAHQRLAAGGLRGRLVLIP